MKLYQPHPPKQTEMKLKMPILNDQVFFSPLARSSKTSTAMTWQPSNEVGYPRVDGRREPGKMAFGTEDGGFEMFQKGQFWPFNLAP